MSNKKGIAILGSTGSIGIAALNIATSLPDDFEVEVLTAASNAELLIEQSLRLLPNTVVIENKAQYKKVSEALWKEDIHVYTGAAAVCQVLESQHIDLVFNAIKGIAGIAPTIAAIHTRKQIALANKESLVICGSLITGLAEQNGVNIYPVDQSHSSIFQSMLGEFHNKIQKLYLTSSGGQFEGFTVAQLNEISAEKIINKGTSNVYDLVNTATLIHDSFKLIEARWLFGLKPEQIDLVIHNPLVINGLVEFADGSIKAQMDASNLMRSIQFAMSYPNRMDVSVPRINLFDEPNFSFKQPDKTNFPNLNHAYSVLEKGGAFSAVLNASNKIAVEAFLEDQIKFTEIASINETMLNGHNTITNPSYDDFMNTYHTACEQTLKLIK